MTTTTGPRERPILFSAPMVRAILDGTKTQTRRAMKPQPQFAQLYEWHGKPLYDGEARRWFWKNHDLGDVCCNSGSLSNELVPLCPYGVVGDRLWVRETIAVHSKYCEGQGIGYFLQWRADDAMRELDPDTRAAPVHDIHPHQKIEDKGWRPSIHMPRWACRIVLQITDVRVQRLQEISEDDARAEGRSLTTGDPAGYFPETWDAINGAGAWDCEPVGLGADLQAPADVQAGDAVTFSEAELRLLRLSDVAEAYKPAHGQKRRRRERGFPAVVGRKNMPLSDEQRAAALELRSRGRSWSWIGNALHLSKQRLERELGT